MQEKNFPNANINLRDRGETLNWNLLACRWVLGEINSEDLPEIAAQALSEGENSTAMAQLAGELRPTARNAGPLFESALKELNVPLPTLDAAVITVAKDIAQRMIQGAMDPQRGANQIIVLSFIHKVTAPELRAFVGLESELSDFSSQVRISHYGKKYCAKVREKCIAQIMQACHDLLDKAK